MLKGYTLLSIGRRHSPTFLAMVLAPLAGTLAGTLFLILISQDVQALRFSGLILVTTYIYVMAVGVPIMLLLKRRGRFNSRAVYLFAGISTLVGGLFFFIMFIYALMWATPVVAIVSAVCFNAIRFKQPPSC